MLLYQGSNEVRKLLEWETTRVNELREQEVMFRAALYFSASLKPLWRILTCNNQLHRLKYIGKERCKFYSSQNSCTIPQV